MRSVPLILAIYAVVVASVALAQNVAPRQQKPLAREIDVKGYKPERPNGDVNHPTTISSSAELEKQIPESVWRGQIAKQVDFTKEQLLLFCWPGSLKDALAFKVQESRNGVMVVFNYTEGDFDENQCLHFRLFAIPKKASWRFATRREWERR